ncbi:MAG: MFS transporter [Promethearchaeota archaeon]
MTMNEPNNIIIESKKKVKKASNEQEKLRSFIYLLIGQFISLFGSSIVGFAIVWWITIETGSSVFLSIAAFLVYAPVIFLVPITGVYADRWNKKQLIIICDFLQAIFTLGLIILFILDMVNIVAVLLLLLLRGICQAFHQPALMAIIPYMIPMQHFSKFNSVSILTSGMLNFIAPVIASSLMIFLSIGQILWVDIVTFLIALIPSIFLKFSVKKRKRKKKSNFRKEFKEGLFALKEIEGLISLLIFFALESFFIVPYFILMPYFVNITHSGTEFDLAMIQALFQAGIVFGSIIQYRKKKWNKKVVTIIKITSLQMLATTFLLFSPKGAFLMIGMGPFIIGFGNAITTALIMTLIQSIIPRKKQGRAISIIIVIVSSSVPLSMIISGFFVELIGIYIYYWICLIAMLIILSLAMLMTSILSLDKRIEERMKQLYPYSLKSKENKEMNYNMKDYSNLKFLRKKTN